MLYILFLQLRGVVDDGIRSTNFTDPFLWHEPMLSLSLSLALFLNAPTSLLLVVLSFSLCRFVLRGFLDSALGLL